MFLAAQGSPVRDSVHPNAHLNDSGFHRHGNLIDNVTDFVQSTTSYNGQSLLGSASCQTRYRVKSVEDVNPPWIPCYLISLLHRAIGPDHTTNTIPG